jgi:hypothetical protein
LLVLKSADGVFFSSDFLKFFFRIRKQTLAFSRGLRIN